MSERIELNYSPGTDGKAVLEIAEKHGATRMRFSGHGSDANEIIQAERDDAGIWHFYDGEME